MYFYSIGGGFEDQIGLGVERIIDYAKRLGLGQTTGTEFSESVGLLPTPAWKQENVPADPIWRVGDTYNLSIGQGMIQVTPVQMARLSSVIAMQGAIPELTFIQEIQNSAGEHVGPDSNPSPRQADISNEAFRIVREGMREAVEYGTAKGLYFPEACTSEYLQYKHLLN